MDASPCAARAVLSRVAAEDALRSRLLLRCPHAQARAAFAGLLLRAFRAGADREGIDSFLAGLAGLEGTSEGDSEAVPGLAGGLERAAADALVSPHGVLARCLVRDLGEATEDEMLVPRVGELFALLRGVAASGWEERRLLASAGFVRVAAAAVSATLRGVETMEIDALARPVVATKPLTVAAPPRASLAEALCLVVRAFSSHGEDAADADETAAAGPGSPPLALASTSIDALAGSRCVIPESYLRPVIDSSVLANLVYFHTAAGVPMYRHLCHGNAARTEAVLAILARELDSLVGICCRNPDERLAGAVRAWVAVAGIQDVLSSSRIDHFGGLSTLMLQGDTLYEAAIRSTDAARGLSVVASGVLELCAASPEAAARLWETERERLARWLAD